ncbi:MAG: hypothetical protein HYS38_03825 [Acidobacteria bacterium]|nr:hypothetical protein [Acidobacteriota bacterium]
MRYNYCVPLNKKAVTFLLPAGVSLLFLINLCALLFQCGCLLQWSGAGLLCNIHTPNVPHCPWCIAEGSGYYVALAAIWLVQAGITFVPSRFSWTRRMVFSLVAFPAIGGLVGFLFAVYAGYPTFLFLRIG